MRETNQRAGRSQSVVCRIPFSAGWACPSQAQRGPAAIGRIAGRSGRLSLTGALMVFVFFFSDALITGKASSPRREAPPAKRCVTRALFSSFGSLLFARCVPTQSEAFGILSQFRPLTSAAEAVESVLGDSCGPPMTIINHPPRVENNLQQGEATLLERHTSTLNLFRRRYSVRGLGGGKKQISCDVIHLEVEMFELVCWFCTGQLLPSLPLSHCFVWKNVLCIESFLDF